jgi:hypothetical protein
MSCVQRQRRAIAWLVVVALLGNAFAFSVRWSSAAVVDHGLGALVICTADGAKTVPGDGSSGRQPADHCPACRLVTPFILAAPVAELVMAVPGLAGARPDAAPAVQVLPHFRPSANRSRAPPLSA